MISLADILKFKETEKNGYSNSSSGPNLENIYLALIKLEWSSNDLTNNLNNTNIYAGGDSNRSSEYAIVKDSGLIDSSAYGVGPNRNFIDQKESIIMQTLKLLCEKPGKSKSNAVYQGPYAYIPGTKYAAYAELGLIVLIFSIWILSMWLCFNRYSKLRLLQPGQPRYNFDPLHINQVRIVQNERDGLIILKKKPSQYDTLRGKNGGGSSKASSILIPYHHHHADLMALQKAANANLVVEPLIVVDETSSSSNHHNATSARYYTTTSSTMSSSAAHDGLPSHHHRSYSEPFCMANQLFVHKSVVTTAAAAQPTQLSTRYPLSYLNAVYRGQQTNSQRGRFERYHTINTTSPYPYPYPYPYTTAAVLSNNSGNNKTIMIGCLSGGGNSPSSSAERKQKQQRRLTKQQSPIVVHLNVTPPPPDHEETTSVFCGPTATMTTTTLPNEYERTRVRAISTSGLGSGAGAANSSGGANLEFVQLTPSPSSLSSSPLKAMLNRVSIRRNMYAKSKWSVNMSFKRLLSTANRVSSSQDAASTSEAGASAVTLPQTNRSSAQQSQNQSQQQHQHHQQQHSEQDRETQAQQDETILYADDELIDPTQIPMRVRKSLLDMHYHLHMKPPLLQTSRISKSDSNIKVPPQFHTVDNKNKKLFSLQKSSYD